MFRKPLFLKNEYYLKQCVLNFFGGRHSIKTQKNDPLAFSRHTKSGFGRFLVEKTPLYDCQIFKNFVAHLRKSRVTQFKKHRFKRSSNLKIYKEKSRSQSKLLHSA